MDQILANVNERKSAFALNYSGEATCGRIHSFRRALCCHANAKINKQVCCVPVSGMNVSEIVGM